MIIGIDLPDADVLAVYEGLESTGLARAEAREILDAYLRDAAMVALGMAANLDGAARRLASDARGTGIAGVSASVGNFIWVVSPGLPTMRAVITADRNGRFTADYRGGRISFTHGAVRRMGETRYVRGAAVRIEGDV